MSRDASVVRPERFAQGLTYAGFAERATIAHEDLADAQAAIAADRQLPAGTRLGTAPEAQRQVLDKWEAEGVTFEVTSFDCSPARMLE